MAQKPYSHCEYCLHNKSCLCDRINAGCDAIKEDMIEDQNRRCFCVCILCINGNKLLAYATPKNTTIKELEYKCKANQDKYEWYYI